MTHLSSSEFADALDGTLRPERAAHLQTCERCRAQAGAAAEALARALRVDVPEPSPLFWDHLSARVRDAIASERPQAARPFVWSWLRPVPLALLASLATIAIALTLSRGRAPVEPPAAGVASPSARAASGATAAGSGSDVVAGGDEAWDLLSDAVSEVELEEARAVGFVVRPGEIDRAVLDMTPVERAALGRLLRQELKRAGA